MRHLNPAVSSKELTRAYANFHGTKRLGYRDNYPVRPAKMPFDKFTGMHLFKQQETFCESSNRLA